MYIKDNKEADRLMRLSRVVLEEVNGLMLDGYNLSEDELSFLRIVADRFDALHSQARWRRSKEKSHFPMNLDWLHK